MRPSDPRPLTAGPDTGPEPPFPIRLSGKVVKGFGRGSKELGIPTANIPIAGLSVGGHEEVESGVYYGWAGLDVDINLDDSTDTQNKEKKEEEKTTNSRNENKSATLPGIEAQYEDANAQGKIYPMVMSIGWNPFYKNTIRSVEVHILHHFPRDFYSSPMKLLILGFIRPEYDYVSRDALIEDIKTDIEVARRSLERKGYKEYREEGWLGEFDGVGKVAS